MIRNDRFRTIRRALAAITLAGFVVINGCKVTRTSLLGFSLRGPVAATGLSLREAAAKLLAARVQIRDCDHCEATGTTHGRVNSGPCERCQGAAVVVVGANLGAADDELRAAVVVAALGRLEVEQRPPVVKGLAGLVANAMVDASPELRARAFGALRNVMFKPALRTA
jgi:hypothetical protein